MRKLVALSTIATLVGASLLTTPAAAQRRGFVHSPGSWHSAYGGGWRGGWNRAGWGLAGAAAAAAVTAPYWGDWGYGYPYYGSSYYYSYPYSNGYYGCGPGFGIGIGPIAVGFAGDCW